MMPHMASRMKELKASEIREILKLTQQPGVISFAGGLPAPELFPVREMVSVSAEVLVTEGSKALQYSTTEGCPRLREAVARRMDKTRGIEVDPEAILITGGSQQGLDLTGKVFIDEGDAVLCESPTYLGAVNAFKAYGPRFVEVPTDDEGMVPEALDRFLAETSRVKFLYAIPDFQNPSGRCWSLERRRSVMEVAGKYGIPVVEDAPYAELRFEGEHLPPLKAFDPHDLVIYLGTFSKILCPGMRVAWLAAQADLVKKYVLVKQGADLHTSTLSQRQVCIYLERYDLDGALDRIRALYEKRRRAMLGAIDAHFPTNIRTTRPQGGLFLWVELPKAVNARDVLVRALEEKVAFVPGGSFFPDGGHENTLRLNYSCMDEERIEEGIRRLAAVLRDYMGEDGPARLKEVG